MRLVGFIITLFHDVWSPERKTSYGIKPMLIYCYLFLVEPAVVKNVCHEGIERKMKGEFNNMKETCSILIGGYCSGICVERASIQHYSLFSKAKI